MEEHLDVIQRCHLSSVIKHTPTEAEPTILDMPISQDSLSAGEKQLVALARAILRRTNVIIMDEATSQIDTKLDDQVRKQIPLQLYFSLMHRTDPSHSQRRVI